MWADMSLNTIVFTVMRVKPLKVFPHFSLQNAWADVRGQEGSIYEQLVVS